MESTETKNPTTTQHSVPQAPQPTMSSTQDSTPQPLDNDLVHQEGAPWTREGAPPLASTDEAKLQILKWKQAVDKAERKRERKRRKEEQREEAKRKAAERLENNARRMYYAGFFFLPLVWLVALIYYRNEHRDPDANPNIKRYYRNSRFFLILYTVVFVAWFVVFEILADGKLKSLNILYFSGTSPNGF